MSPPIARRRGRPPRQIKEPMVKMSEIDAGEFVDTMPHIDAGEVSTNMPHTDATPPEELLIETAQPAPILATMSRCPKCGGPLRSYASLPVGICGPCGLSFECIVTREGSTVDAR